MKTNSRKRLLVSSVAMLLVAMLALGTATYAWFTTSTTATANNLSVKTSKSSTLLLGKDNASKTDDTNWSDSLSYDADNDHSINLKPASSADGVNWFKAVAGASDSYAASAAPTAAMTELNGYVFKNQLNIWNHGDNAINGVTIKFKLSETPATSGNESYKYLRLALVEASGIGTDARITGTFNSNNADHKGGVFAAGADTANAYKYDNENNVTTETVEPADASEEVTINVGNLTADAKKSYNLYVWFEGQDEDCCDDYSGNVMPNITFTVSGTSEN